MSVPAQPSTKPASPATFGENDVDLIFSSLGLLKAISPTESATPIFAELVETFDPSIPAAHSFLLSGAHFETLLFSLRLMYGFANASGSEIVDADGHNFNREVTDELTELMTRIYGWLEIPQADLETHLGHAVAYAREIVVGLLLGAGGVPVTRAQA